MSMSSTTACKKCLTTLTRPLVLQSVRQYHPVFSASQGLSRKKDLLAHEKLPIYDYGSVNPSKSRIYGFGCTAQGALGLANLLRPKGKRTKVMRYVTRPVRHEFGDFRDVQDIAAGHGFTLACTKSAEGPTLWGCGLNTHSQLGFQSVRPQHPLEVLINFIPIYLPGSATTKQTKILALGAGRAHSVVSTEKGIYTFGDNSNGQCGRLVVEDENYFGSRLFHHIQIDEEIIGIVCRFDVSFCLTSSGKLYSFGCNHQGQLGRGAKLKKSWEIGRVNGGDLGEEKVIKVATSGSSVLAVTENGDLFSWGDNEMGHINPDESGRCLYEPIHVRLKSSVGKIVDVSVGDMFSHLVNARGRVYSFGQGSCLGLGPANQIVRRPTVIPPPLFGANEFNPKCKIVNIYSGFFYSAAVTNQGDLYTWGKNESGCLGLGDVNEQSFPLKVCLNGSVHKVGIGVDHTVVMARGNI